jgi:hypothetical protein
MVPHLKESNMNFIRHIGKHGDRNIAILYRQVPGEDHMCLVIQPDILPAHWHDTIMKVLESDIGQQANELADALHRNLLPDGRNILETLHFEKMIKKVRTSDVIVTPRPGATIRLDELNKMLNEMEKGSEAVKKMAQNDASRGLVDAPTKRAAEAEFKRTQAEKVSAAKLQADPNSALSDRDIAGNMLTQAQRMEAEAKNMLAESARMKKEAERMFPNVVAKEISATGTPAKRGRPSKAKTAVADAS